MEPKDTLDDKLICKNCGSTLDKGFAFCPNCGQDTSSRFVSLGVLFIDFLGDFFNFDSKFFTSIIPFVIKPGVMTRDFLDGRRIRYIPPIRIFIFISILYGLVLTQIANRVDWANASRFVTSGSFVKINGDSILLLNDVGDSVLTAPSDLPKEMRDSLVRVIRDSLSVMATDLFIKTDSIAVLSDIALLESLDSTVVDTSGSRGDDWMGKFIRLAETDLTPDEVAGAMVTTESEFLKRGVGQMAKIYRSGGKDFVAFLLGNVTIFLLLALPFFAFILKLFYWRRGKYFTEHFIYSTHSHAFLVFLLLISAIVFWILNVYPTWLMFLSIPYYFFSLKKVYQQSWRKTILKGTLLMGVYAIVILPTFMLVTIAVSFMLF